MENQRNGVVMKEPSWAEVAPGIWNIMMPPAFNEYLILGGERALLVDTGMGIGSLREIVDRITDLPVEVILTHCHPDHAGGALEWAGKVRCCPADLDVFRRMATLEFRRGDLSHMPGGEENARRLLPTGPEPAPIQDGAELDLGDRKVTVLYTPGHTHGSLSVYDRTTGALCCGDNVMATVTSMAGEECSSIAVLADSLTRMKAFKPTLLLGGHMPNVNPPELLDRVLALCLDLLNGVQGTPRPGSASWLYQRDGVGISYRPDHIR